MQTPLNLWGSISVALTSGPYYCEPDVIQPGGDSILLCSGNFANECKRRNHLGLHGDLSRVADTGYMAGLGNSKGFIDKSYNPIFMTMT
jgi:hypothetical protein